MIEYNEGFYAVNGNRSIVGLNEKLSVPDKATVEVFSTLAELDTAYPPAPNDISGVMP